HCDSRGGCQQACSPTCGHVCACQTGQSGAIKSAPPAASVAPKVSPAPITTVAAFEPAQQSPPKRETKPYLAHAPDYHFIAGELWYSPSQKAWRVHYGSKREDAYGGILDLTGLGSMKDFTIGQAVYAEGQLVSMDAQTGAAAYRVTKILDLVQQPE